MGFTLNHSSDGEIRSRQRQGGRISFASTLGSTDNIIGEAGYVFKTEHVTGQTLGLYTVRHRHYEPGGGLGDAAGGLGRWLSRDPIGYVDGMSLYEYVRSRPSGLSDMSGLISIKDDFGPYGPPIYVPPGPPLPPDEPIPSDGGEFIPFAPRDTIAPDNPCPCDRPLRAPLQDGGEPFRWGNPACCDLCDDWEQQGAAQWKLTRFWGEQWWDPTNPTFRGIPVPGIGFCKCIFRFCANFFRNCSHEGIDLGCDDGRRLGQGGEEQRFERCTSFKIRTTLFRHTDFGCADACMKRARNPNWSPPHNPPQPFPCHRTNCDRP